MANAEQTAISSYRAEITADIEACVSKMGCQPILFVGSGLSKRYFDGPNWDELLTILAKECPLIERDYAYYKQTLKTQLAVGESFAEIYQQWAWDKGKNQFPADMFSDQVSAQSYIKYFISRYLESKTPVDIEAFEDEKLKSEIVALREIRPHAIITTNYDKFLELVFPEYQAVIGQNIIREAPVLFGEIFKIHGCVSDYNSLVFTQSDYDEFTKKKRYLSAKLLTFFSEHPLLFAGYSATDPNIISILSDIDEAIPRPGPSGTLIPNIYILEWRKEIQPDYIPAREKLIPVKGGRSVRIKSIESDDFEWVFSAFGSNQPINAVSPKILRALLRRSYDLVRHDIPRTPIHVDFEMLSRAVSSGPEFAKLFGITTISKPSSNSVNYPYILSEVAEQVWGKGARWHRVKPYLDKIKEEKDIDIQKSDNRYHCATKTGKGKNSFVRKYSLDFVDLLNRMKNNLDYEIDL